MVKPGESKTFEFFNPFRTAKGEISEKFGMLSISFEGIGGMLTTQQTLVLAKEMLEYLDIKTTRGFTWPEKIIDLEKV